MSSVYSSPQLLWRIRIYIRMFSSFFIYLFFYGNKGLFRTIQFTYLHNICIW